MRQKSHLSGVPACHPWWESRSFGSCSGSALWAFRTAHENRAAYIPGKSSEKKKKKKVPVRLALFLPGASSVQAEWTGPLTMSAELSEPGLICRCAAHIRYLTPPGREATWLRWRHADAIQTAHTHIHTRRERLPRRPLVVALFIRTLISLSVTYHGI